MDQFHPTPTYWAVILPTILLAFAVLGWLAWSRWLSHKETMRAAELGGDSREALLLRERWQIRRGILWAVKALALGVALVVVAVMARKWDTVAVRRVFGWQEMMLVVGAAAFLVVIGLVTLAAYAMWSRAQEVVERPEREAESERWRIRWGLLGAATMLALGAAIAVALVIADNWDTFLGRRVIGPGEMLLLIGVMVFLLGMGTVMLVAHGIWSRPGVGPLGVGLLGGEKKEESDAGRDAEGEGGE